MENDVINTLIIIALSMAFTGGVYAFVALIYTMCTSIKDGISELCRKKHQQALHKRVQMHVDSHYATHAVLKNSMGSDPRQRKKR